MKKYIIPCLAALCMSCGETPTAVENSSERSPLSSVELRDSADAMAYDSEADGHEMRALELYDQVLKLDPKDKKAHTAKIDVLADVGSSAELLLALNEAYTEFPNDPFIALHLGMEYELQQKNAEAAPLYVASVGGFYHTLDTMSRNSDLVRNSFLMNMAIANVLSSNLKSNSEVGEILSESEMENYLTAQNQFTGMERAALLNLRRRSN